MKKKLAVLGLAATMMMSLFAGCGGKGSSGGKDASADKGSVYYLNFKPEADAQWQELAKIYEEETGVKVWHHGRIIVQICLTQKFTSSLLQRISL